MKQTARVSPINKQFQHPSVEHLDSPRVDKLIFQPSGNETVQRLLFKNDKT